MADLADRAAEAIENRIEGTLASFKLPPKTFADPYCEDCGIDIPQARRDAAPWATTCIECQGIRESKARHHR